MRIYIFIVEYDYGSVKKNAISASFRNYSKHVSLVLQQFAHIFKCRGPKIVRNRVEFDIIEEGENFIALIYAELTTYSSTI